MPELPEVETVVKELNSHAICGCSFTYAHIGWPKTIGKRSTTSFKRAVQGAQIKRVSRRGKYIIISLSGERRLLVHLRMTGKLYFQDKSFKAGRHDHVVFSLSDQRKLVFNDTRKFGRITLLSKTDEDPTEQLGPEPLGSQFTISWLRKALNSRNRQLKPLLLDQSFVAGLGNIYVDEALWEARVHPERLSKSITTNEAEALYRGIRTVLKRGIKNCGTTLGAGSTNFYSVAGRRGRNADELNVFRRTGKPCPACGTPIQRIVVGQRSTHLCPKCQSFSNPHHEISNI